MKRPNVGARLRAPDPVALAAGHEVAAIPSRGQEATQIAHQHPSLGADLQRMAPVPANTRPDTQMRAPVMARV